MWQVTDFNPRSREGSDWPLLASCRFGSDFNPRSREGSDVICSTKVVGLALFQSTLP